jgi:3-deoxy-7-phosphoheptulonate synthase
MHRPSTIRWTRDSQDCAILTLPRIGARGVLSGLFDRYSETPGVLRSARCCQTIVPAVDLEIGGGEFVTMAGPCSVESEQQLMATAEHLERAGVRILRGGAFKPRSSPYAFQGLGIEGLKLLARARAECGLAIVTEVMSETDADLAADYADILQIGSRNMENFSLLEAAARTGRPILLKRGMVASVADLLRSAECVLANGNPHVMLCERGIRTFDSALRNTFDAGAIALLKRVSHLPVIADPSHACGRRDMVPALARIGVAAGADGMIVEVHPDPAHAWSDGDQSLSFDEFDSMMASLAPWIALRDQEQARFDATRGLTDALEATL